MQNCEIAPLEAGLLVRVKSFTDRWIGKNYFDQNQLAEILDRSRVEGFNCSLVAMVDGEVAGVRLTFAPGSWTRQASGVTPDMWRAKLDQVAYFKSLFIAEKFQRLGLGRSLSSMSIEVLRQMGATAVVCHSWLESPENSSQIYLQKMGFEPVKTHPNFWADVDYICPRCAPRRCECSAVEMIKYL